MQQQQQQAAAASGSVALCEFHTRVVVVAVCCLNRFAVRFGIIAGPPTRHQKWPKISSVAAHIA